MKDGDHNQVLTEADTAISRLLADSVRRSFPADDIIDEESGVIGSGSRRVGDRSQRRDKQLRRRAPALRVMIGLPGDAAPTAGGIALPAFGEIYIAERLRGATCNGASIRGRA